MAVLTPFGDLGFGAVFVLYLGRDLGKSGAIRDLLAKVVALGQHLAHGTHDVVGMGIVLGENQRFRYFGAAGECIGQHLVAKLLKHRANLTVRNYIAVELVGA